MTLTYLKNLFHFQAQQNAFSGIQPNPLEACRALISQQQRIPPSTTNNPLPLHPSMSDLGLVIKNFLSTFFVTLFNKVFKPYCKIHNKGEKVDI